MPERVSRHKLIALDLDGTLLDTDKRLSARNATALQIAAASAWIVPTTGRFFDAMPESVKELPYIRYATSSIEDMLKYAQLQLDESGVFKGCHKVIKQIDATTESNELMDIRTDAVGMAWIVDNENGIVWHNGGTGNYNCYLGFCPESGTAVVILSNLAPSYRIPATVMGAKLLKENK